MYKNSIALALALVSPLALNAQSFESAVNIANENGNVTVTGPIRQVPEAVLFNQGPLTNGLNGTTPISILQTGAPFTYCTLGSTGTGAFRLADDFTVPPGGTWTVNSVTVFGYQTGATAASINNATLRILNGSPTGTPTVLFGDQTTNRLGTAALSGSFRVTDTTLTATNRAIQAITITISPALQLTAGTYWIDFNAAGTVASGPFFPPVVPALTAPAPTGNALQFANGAWNPLTQGIGPDCAAPTPGPAQGLPFIVEGSDASVPPSITLSKRVQLSTGSTNTCVTTGTSVTLPFGGGAIDYCYAVTNTGASALITHNLVDPAFATPVLSNFAFNLAPAASVTVRATKTVTATESTGATWSACNQATNCTGATVASASVAAGTVVAGVAEVAANTFSSWSLGLMLLGIGGIGMLAFRRQG